MKKLLLLALMAWSSLESGAQITVTSSTFPAAGDILRYVQAANPSIATALFTPPGGNQFWDLSALTPASTFEVSYRPAAEGAFNAAFPAATMVVSSGTDEYYYTSKGAAAAKAEIQFWPPSDPASEGIDPLIIEAIHQEITAGKYGLIDHFLVIRHGKLVADYRYNQDYKTIAQKYDTTNHQFNYDHPDWHPYYKGTNLHTLQSVTKSITSALLGIALERHKIPGPQVKVMPFFKEYTFDLTDPRKQDISLEDLLTMRSGIEWDEASYDDPDNDCILMEASDQWVNFVLNKPMDTIPGVVFEYNSGASVLLGKLVRIITGKRIDQWAEEVLFKPLGITDYYWKATPDGELDTEGGLYLSVHDLAKIGLLFLRKGKWEGAQIIPEAWAIASTSPIVSHVNPLDSRSPGYGYQWWAPKHNNGKSEIFAGNGFGGQFLMVAPKYDVIVVFNGWNIHDRPEKSTWQVLEERIIPGIRK